MDDQTGKTSSGLLRIIAILGTVVVLIVVSVASFGALVSFGAKFNLPTGSSLVQAGGVVVGADCQAYQNVKLTGYLTGPGVTYTSASQKKTEGGPNDRTGQPNKTLFEYINGQYSNDSDAYVSLAADNSPGSPVAGKYHVKAYIPSIEQKLNNSKEIIFRIVDTGGDFVGTKLTRIDVAVSQNSQTFDPALNEATTVYIGEGCTRSSVTAGMVGQGNSDLATQIAQKAAYYAGDPAGQAQFKNSCPAGVDSTSCSNFVARVMHEVGADDNFLGKLAYDQYLYAKASSCYIQIPAISDTNQLIAGDILFRPGKNANGIGHTGIYIGSGNIAAASLNSHDPIVGPWTTSSVLTYGVRIKGSACPKS